MTTSESPFLEEGLFAYREPDHIRETMRAEAKFAQQTPFSPAFEQVELEQEVLGTDTRVPVPNVLRAPYRWICSLDLYHEHPDWGKHGAPRWREPPGKGSGVLIGPDCVLTAAHVLYDRDRRTNKVTAVGKIEVTPARNGKDRPLGTTPGVDWKTNRRWDPKAPSFGHDFALIKIKDAIGEERHDALNGKKLGWWGSKTWGEGTRLKRLDPGFFTKMTRRVWSSGYPGDKCGRDPRSGSLSEAAIEKCVRNSPDLWASVQWIGSGILTWVRPTVRLMHHTIDTYEGHSGAPVWYRYKDIRWLVGLHVAPATQQANSAVRVTREFVREIAHLRSQL